MKALVGAFNMSTVKLQRFVDSCTIQTDNECVRGGQHPHHPAVQGEGQGQDPALVHVRHGHGPAPHGQSRLYNTLWKCSRYFIILETFCHLMFNFASCTLFVPTPELFHGQAS